MPVIIICLLIAPEDLSTAALLFVTCLLMMFIGRISFKFVFLLIIMGIIGLSILVMIGSVFPDLVRVDTWISRINDFMYNTDGGYQLQQSKIAIASGEITGVGPGNSMQRNFLPFAYADFIYAIIVEEYGLIGGFTILGLYSWLLFRCTRIVTRCPKTFGAILAMGLCLNIVIQAFANIAVSVQLVPATGLTLPLVSMGGTSILFTCISLGIILSVSRYVEEAQYKQAAIEKMENASINKGYQKLKKSISSEYQKAWETGKTGFPLIDACMRCLKETGYLNFRMRAMVVSFFTHILWQPWQASSQHLSRLFLDFEPGIHFSQLQMSAGETGINLLRIYNPIKNSLSHDEDGTFIKKWVPELAHLPISFIHEPYLMTTLDQQFNNFKLGEAYPNPIIEIKHARKKASDILWNMKKDARVKEENYRILKKHTNSEKNKM